MLHPRDHARHTPDKPACIAADSGKSLTYEQLEAGANRSAHLLRFLGLQRGQVLAVMLDNELPLFEIAWASERSGLYLTSVSTRLSRADAAYIIEDSGAKVLIVSDRLATDAEISLKRLRGIRLFTVSAWQEAAKLQPAIPIADESAGTDMLYSSGTTGRPKGVKPPLPNTPLGSETPLTAMGRTLYCMGEEMVYLSTSPLYHAAPLRWAMTAQRFGGSVIVMSKFDAEQALELIQRYRVTHSTWVPTHFVRLLKLPSEVRASYDVSSMQAAIHASAPCPVPVKQAMIDWWGPVIEEYYAGTESCGITALSSREWLQRRGSVGKPALGKVHILDDAGRDLPPGEVGQVWFSDGPTFEYHNDPAKTAGAYNERGWATLGDIGLLDDEGYLFLKDRKNFMIISGGVNIYPQEIENLLVTHPKVADVAVVGAPDEEMGEIVVAVVQPAAGISPDAALCGELREFARAELGGVKCPKRFEFRAELPREPTGKLLKAALVQEFRSEAVIQEGR